MEFVLAVVSAFWLGILTSVSPCPMASNIAAISFISKRLSRWGVFCSGFAYTLGRVIAYALVGWLIVGSFLSLPSVAQFLQKYMGKALGPVFIIAGFIVFFEVKMPFIKTRISDGVFDKLLNSGVMGDFALGFILALAFCPISAAMFFGSLIPLAISTKSGIALPIVYGVGTGLPVLAIALMVAMGFKSFAGVQSKVNGVELYLKRVTGVIFVIAGIYYLSVYWLGVF